MLKDSLLIHKKELPTAAVVALGMLPLAVPSTAFAGEPIRLPAPPELSTFFCDDPVNKRLTFGANDWANRETTRCYNMVGSRLVSRTTTVEYTFFARRGDTFYVHKEERNRRSNYKNGVARLVTETRSRTPTRGLDSPPVVIT